MRVKSQVWAVSLLRSRRLAFFASVVVFACVGLVVISSIRAATGVADVEPEAGTPSASTEIIADVNASGGSAVRFVTASYNKPNAENTGVPIGHTPTLQVTDTDRGITVSANGNVRISKSGVFEDMLITGRLNITADNVTIRYSRIEANPNPYDLPDDPTSVTECNTLGAVTNQQAVASYGRTNVVIEDSEIEAVRPSTFLGNGIHGSGYTLRRVDISGTVDGAGIFSTTGAANVVIENSYIHDLYVGAYDYGKSCGPSHTDGIQIHYGSAMIIRNNTLRPNSITPQVANAAIMVNQNSSYYTSDVTIEGNWIDYGACSINANDGGKVPTIQSLKILNNRFGKNQSTSPKCAMIITAATRADPGYSVTGNTWEDGSTPAPTVTNGG